MEYIVPFVLLGLIISYSNKFLDNFATYLGRLNNEEYFFTTFNTLLQKDHNLISQISIYVNHLISQLGNSTKVNIKRLEPNKVYKAINAIPFLIISLVGVPILDLIYKIVAIAYISISNNMVSIFIGIVLMIIWVTELILLIVGIVKLCLYFPTLYNLYKLDKEVNC